MKIEKALAFIMAEIERAEKLHPVWPYDNVKAAGVVSEEAGELIRACNNYDEYKLDRKNIITEAVHTAASAIRFLKNFNEETIQ